MKKIKKLNKGSKILFAERFNTSNEVKISLNATMLGKSSKLYIGRKSKNTKTVINGIEATNQDHICDIQNNSTFMMELVAQNVGGNVWNVKEKVILYPFTSYKKIVIDTFEFHAEDNFEFSINIPNMNLKYDTNFVVEYKDIDKKLILIGIEDFQIKTEYNEYAYEKYNTLPTNNYDNECDELHILFKSEINLMQLNEIKSKKIVYIEEQNHKIIEKIIERKLTNYDIVILKENNE